MPACRDLGFGRLPFSGCPAGSQRTPRWSKRDSNRRSHSRHVISQRANELGLGMTKARCCAMLRADPSKQRPRRVDRSALPSRRIPLHRPPVPIFWRGCRRARLPHRTRALHENRAAGRRLRCDRRLPRRHRTLASRVLRLRAALPGAIHRRRLRRPPRRSTPSATPCRAKTARHAALSPPEAAKRTRAAPATKGASFGVATNRPRRCARKRVSWSGTALPVWCPQR
jgi:hypothetical protein